MNEKVAFALSLFPAFYMFPGALVWKVIHISHHATSDTPNDTNNRGIRAFFGSGYKQPEKRFVRLAINLARDPKHSFIHKYHLLLVGVYGLLMFVISPTLFLYGFAVPVFTTICIGRIHHQFGHNDTRPLNLWFLEYIIPHGGDWIHANHHDQPSNPQFSTRWYQIDTGGLFIKFITSNLLRKKLKNE